jgi:hypothetical protein
MALRGKAFMAVRHDITAAAEAEYNTWHTRQHRPEGRPEMTAALLAVHGLVREAVNVVSAQSAVYDLAYLLTAEDVA